MHRHFCAVIANIADLHCPWRPKAPSRDVRFKAVAHGNGEAVENLQDIDTRPDQNFHGPVMGMRPVATSVSRMRVRAGEGIAIPRPTTTSNGNVSTIYTYPLHGAMKPETADDDEPVGPPPVVTNPPHHARNDAAVVGPAVARAIEAMIAHAVVSPWSLCLTASRPMPCALLPQPLTLPMPSVLTLCAPGPVWSTMPSPMLSTPPPSKTTMSV